MMNASPSAPPLPSKQGQHLFRMGMTDASTSSPELGTATIAGAPVAHTDEAYVQYLQEIMHPMSQGTCAPDAQFFGAFDSLSAELDRMQAGQNAGAGVNGSAQEQQDLRQRLAQIQQSQMQIQHSYAALASKGREREARIRRNSQGLLHSTILMPQTWFRGGVEGKIQRQRDKLAVEAETMSQLDQQMQACALEAAQAQQRLLGIEQSEAKIRYLSDLQVRARNSAVAYARRSLDRGSRLAAMRERSSAQQADAMVRKVRRCVDACIEAIGLFNQALGWEQQAGLDNAIAINDTWWSGGGMFEQMDQMQRNRDMRQANRLAMRGARALDRLSRIIQPRDKLRERFPALCAPIGTTPIPLLQQQNFGEDLAMDWAGGGFGAYMSDLNAGDKIAANMAVIQTCHGIAAQQYQHVLALLGCVQQEQMQMQQAGLAEDDRLFAELRAAAGC